MIVERLKALFGEQHQITLVGNAGLIELWVNMDTGSWTAMRTDVEGISCLLESGTGLIMDRKPSPPGNDI